MEYAKYSLMLTFQSVASHIPMTVKGEDFWEQVSWAYLLVTLGRTTTAELPA